MGLGLFAAILYHISVSKPFTLTSVGFGRVDCFPVNKLDFGAFEVLAPVKEPLNCTDNEDDEEGHNAVVWKEHVRWSRQKARGVEARRDQTESKINVERMYTDGSRKRREFSKEVVVHEAERKWKRRVLTHVTSCSWQLWREQEENSGN